MIEKIEFQSLLWLFSKKFPVQEYLTILSSGTIKNAISEVFFAIS
jgi:hypothetical protein